MGDTGSELVGLLLLVLLVGAVVGIIGFKTIDWLEAHQSQQPKLKTGLEVEKVVEKIDTLTPGDHYHNNADNNDDNITSNNTNTSSVVRAEFNSTTTSTLPSQPRMEVEPFKLTKPTASPFLMVFLVALPVLSGLVVIIAVLLRTSPPYYGIGQSATINNSWSVEVVAYEQTGKHLEPGSNGSYPSPNLNPVSNHLADPPATINNNNSLVATAVGNWHLVQIALTNLTSQSLRVDYARFFEIRDSRNNAYLPSTDPSASAYASQRSEDCTKQETIESGQKCLITLVYDIEPNATGLELVFNQGSEPHFRLTSGAAR